jgi:hypothetical protein
MTTATPRTDAVLRAAQVTPLTIYGDFEAALDLARTLERDNAQLREALAETVNQLATLQGERRYHWGNERTNLVSAAIVQARAALVTP